MPARTPPQDAMPDLFGESASASVEVHRLFLALLPDAATAGRMAAAAEAWRDTGQAAQVRWVKPARYHATLHFLGDHPTLPNDLVDAVEHAAGTVRRAPFLWTLDRATAFHGRQPPCILGSVSVPAALQALWDAWALALAKAGLGRHLERRFTPHVTLGYSRSGMPAMPSIAPIDWRVDGVALVHSVVGQADYRVLARWPLRTA